MRRVVAVLAATALLLWSAAVAAQGQPTPGDPSDSLDQTIDSGQAIATDQKVLTTGHVDMGPKFAGGQPGADWTLMIHDDTGKSTGDPSAWRHLDRTVLQIPDKAILTVPDDPTYSFIGTPGTRVYVLPQVQNPDVAWVGWNTQDPQVMDTIDGGVTLTMTGVDGPGKLIVYLQAGNFGEPDVLWESTKDGPQDLWVDVNTHTHANWVFTEPGVYLVTMTVTADLLDGRTVTDTQALRFAVGDDTTADAAFAAAAPTATPAGTSAPATGNAPRDDAAGEDGGGPNPLVLAIGGVALVLIGGVIAVAVRSRSAKRRASAGRGSGRDES